MTHSFGFKRISGLPSGTVLSCFYLSRIRYFGTSTGNLITRNENQKFSLKECFISDHYVIEVLRYMLDSHKLSERATNLRHDYVITSSLRDNFSIA